MWRRTYSQGTLIRQWRASLFRDLGFLDPDPRYQIRVIGCRERDSFGGSYLEGSYQGNSSFRCWPRGKTPITEERYRLYRDNALRIPRDPDPNPSLPVVDPRVRRRRDTDSIGIGSLVYFVYCGKERERVMASIFIFYNWGSPELLFTLP